MLKYLCLLLGPFLLVNAESLTIYSDDDCGKKYRLDKVESVSITFKGHSLNNDQCVVEFTIESLSDHSICVQPLTLNLDCNTRVEYQNHFVAESINDGVLDCDMNRQRTYNETCAGFVSKFFLVFKKTDSYRECCNQLATFRVYAKEKGTGSGILWLSALAIIPFIILFICICVCCYKIKKRQHQQYANTQITYATTTAPTSLQTGGVQGHPGNTYVYPGEAASQQALLQQSGNTRAPGDPLAGYHIHRVAYSTDDTPTAPGTYNFQPLPQSQYTGMQAATTHTPSAPPGDDTAAPPPSYDSIFRDQTS